MRYIVAGLVGGELWRGECAHLASFLDLPQDGSRILVRIVIVFIRQAMMTGS